MLLDHNARCSFSSGTDDSRSINENDPKSSEKKKRRVVVVDDLTDLLNLYVTILTLHGAEVPGRFQSGEEIIEAAKRGELSEVDTVIMDYRMKEVDGFQAAKQILEFNPRISVIIASADESIKKEAKAVGFRFLRKPFSTNQLIDSLG
ncbi:MAG: response regulator [Nitrososphaerales archaeon]